MLLGTRVNELAPKLAPNMLGQGEMKRDSQLELEAVTLWKVG